MKHYLLGPHGQWIVGDSGYARMASDVSDCILMNRRVCAGATRSSIWMVALSFAIRIGRSLAAGFGTCPYGTLYAFAHQRPCIPRGCCLMTPH